MLYWKLSYLTSTTFFQVLLTQTSLAVGDALSWKFWPAQYIVVVPSHWKENSCRITFTDAKGETRFKVTLLINFFALPPLLVRLQT